MLRTNISWINVSGDEKHLFGTSRWHGDHFEWRRSRLFRTSMVRWTALGASLDGNIIVIRLNRARSAPGSIDVTVRDDVRIDNLRTVISRSPDLFGLTGQEITQLSLLVPEESL